jgi:hypothetical protein
VNSGGEGGPADQGDPREMARRFHAGTRVDIQVLAERIAELNSLPETHPCKATAPKVIAIHKRTIGALRGGTRAGETCTWSGRGVFQTPPPGTVAPSRANPASLLERNVGMKLFTHVAVASTVAAALLLVDHHEPRAALRRW